jgi:Holliday junction resolvase RusA-like endonuclease
MISFFVPGLPIAKGSAKGIPFRRTNGKLGVSITQTNAEKQKPWASIIGVMAQNTGMRPTDGPVNVDLKFTFTRPKSHYGTGKNKSLVKASAPDFHLIKPDLDKIVRCVFDALTGIAWKDDSQCVGVTASKRYGDQAGCLISVSQSEGCVA